jgi:hypothetical protein
VGKGLSEPDADVKLLLKEIMPVTQRGLEERMGFLPVAALVNQNGTVRRLESEGGAATKQAVALLKEKLRCEVETGSARSAAVAADVMIWRKADGDEASSAVSIHVEHQDGYCVDLLIPYKVRKGLMSRLRKKPQVMFRKMIAQESQPVFWAVQR